VRLTVMDSFFEGIYNLRAGVLRDCVVVVRLTVMDSFSKGMCDLREGVLGD